MNEFSAVHQFHSGTASGDAVTQNMLYLRTQLQEMGYESEIFAEHVGANVPEPIYDVGSYGVNGRQLLLWHHSMGNDAFERLLRMPHRVIAVYHNVTPAEYFTDPTQRYYSWLGREQLRLLAKVSAGGIAASNYNRREMLSSGFDSAEVLPPRTDFKSLAQTGPDRQRSTDWLFVGRVVANKCQRDVVRAFAYYARSFDTEAQLLLIGDLSDAEYVRQVLEGAQSLGVAGRVRLLGKVPESELVEQLHRCGLYVSMSEHEGFGVPLLEAMASGLPILAYAAAAIPETLGGAGILIRSKDPRAVASTAEALRRDVDFRDRLIQRQHRRVAAIQRLDPKVVLRRVIDRTCNTAARTELQVQGPFETSYSLAILNRKLALSLSEDPTLNVSVYPTEGPGDYVPSIDDLSEVPESIDLYRRSLITPYPEVVIRQMWPPRVIDSPGGITCSYFGWEESKVPRSIVEDFNAYVDVVGVYTDFVRDALISSGIDRPVGVVGIGVDRPDPTARCLLDEVQNLKGFRFLHISSGFPRKGVDVLLRAYFEAFDANSDVSLILKTFPNPHNELADVLDELRANHADPPDVRWIDRDLTRSQIEGLYNLASCYVHPARGEGFGLPVAEAMLADIPVISVEYSGLADFVSTETATVIPFSLAPARTHFNVQDSVWAEPDFEALVAAMRGAVSGDDAFVEERLRRAREVIENRYTWQITAARWRNLIAEARTREEVVRVALVSTWNSKCGIAEYSQYLLDASTGSIDFELYANHGVEMVDPSGERMTVRCWWDRWKPDLRQLEQELELSLAEVVHVQFNFGFFELTELGRFIENQRLRRGVVVTLHRTEDAVIDGTTVSLSDVRKQLLAADRLVVHQQADADNLARFGIRENVVLIEQGAPPPPLVSRSEVRNAMGLDRLPVVATFGFLLPHKGTLSLIGMLDHLRDEIPDLHLLALTARHPDPLSLEYERAVREETSRRNLGDRVRLITQYLPDDLARTMLSAADVIVLPYRPTPESSSAAARFVLPAGRPVIASDLPIFADARDAIFTYPAGDQSALERAIRTVLADPVLANRLAVKASTRASRARWGLIAAAHADVYRAAREAGRARESRHRRSVPPAASLSR